MARKRRRKKRRIRVKAVLRLLGILVSLILFLYLVIVLFEVKKIDVTGTVYSSGQEVLKWVQSDKYSSNTLYVLWKYNRDDLKQLPAIRSTRVKMKSPWEVVVQVTEKEFSGRMDYDGAYLYFDKDGMACLKTDAVIEGVPCIEGMEYEQDKVRLGETLPAADQDVFEKLGEVTKLLKEAELTPDKINCGNAEITLWFGGVRVLLGSGGYEDKLAQVPPLLAKLNELYAGQTGEFHLENYTTADSSIRFVPDAAAEQ